MVNSGETLDPHPTPRKKTQGKMKNGQQEGLGSFMTRWKACPSLREKVSEVMKTTDIEGLREKSPAEGLIIGLLHDLGYKYELDVMVGDLVISGPERTC